MTNEEIEAFLTVVKMGTITDAAQELGVTQPALSRRISTLETELGCPLFERTRGKRTVAITRGGASFIYIAQRYRSVMLDCQMVNNKTYESLLRVGAIESFSDIVLPQATRGFFERHPSCQLSLYKCISSRGIQSVQDDECDIAIVAHSLDNDNIMSEALFEDPYCLLSTTPLESDHLGKLDHNKEVFCQWTPAIYSWHNQRFSTPSWPHVMTNHLQMFDALFEGDVWSIVPWSWGNAFAQKQQAYLYKIKNPPPPRIIYSVRKVLSSNPLVDEFLAILRQEISEQLSGIDATVMQGEVEAPTSFF